MTEKQLENVTSRHKTRSILDTILAFVCSYCIEKLALECNIICKR